MLWYGDFVWFGLRKNIRVLGWWVFFFPCCGLVVVADGGGGCDRLLKFAVEVFIIILMSFLY